MLSKIRENDSQQTSKKRGNSMKSSNTYVLVLQDSRDACLGEHGIELRPNSCHTNANVFLKKFFFKVCYLGQLCKKFPNKDVSTSFPMLYPPGLPSPNEPSRPSMFSLTRALPALHTHTSRLAFIWKLSLCLTKRGHLHHGRDSTHL